MGLLRDITSLVSGEKVNIASCISEEVEDLSIISLTVYINGIDQTLTFSAYDDDSMVNGTTAYGKMFIGRGPDVVLQYLNSQLKLLRVYNDIKTQSEITQAITDNGDGTFQPNLTDYSTTLNDNINLFALGKYIYFDSESDFQFKIGAGIKI